MNGAGHHHEGLTLMCSQTEIVMISEAGGEVVAASCSNDMYETKDKRQKSRA